MTKILMAAFLIVLSPALSWAGQDPAGPEAAVVVKSVENMFRSATEDTDVVSQALLGDNVKVLKKEKNAQGEDWCQIETPDTYQGWVVASALRFLKPGEKPYASAGRIFVVSALLANTYREPDVTAHKPLKIAPISAALEIVGEKGERWLEVALPCGHRAWVQKGDGDIREAPWTWPRLPVADTVAQSKRFLGINYLWGGTSPLGLDCSGFAQLDLQDVRRPHPARRRHPDDQERPRRGPQGPGAGRRPHLLRGGHRPDQPRRHDDRRRVFHQRDNLQDAVRPDRPAQGRALDRRSTRRRAGPSRASSFRLCSGIVPCPRHPGNR